MKSAGPRWSTMVAMLGGWFLGGVLWPEPTATWKQLIGQMVLLSVGFCWAKWDAYRRLRESPPPVVALDGSGERG